nr:hypothetical protein [Tanacetum cinerariifolium]
MEAEFQRRITSIENFLKIPRSPNLEKTSNVAAECMSVDKNPSCGSDIKAGNKESMCVDSSVNTSCAADINANNVHNDSMNFNHDPKVQREAKAIEDFVKRLRSALREEGNHYKKPTEIKMFMHSFRGRSLLLLVIVNTASLKFLLLEFIICVELNGWFYHKVRTRNKKLKKRGLPLTTHDGKVIPYWKEDLFRPKHAPKTRTIVPAEISDMLQENKDKCFYFPWTNEGSYVCSKFRKSLLALEKERRGWFSDTMSCCYVDGVTYSVPWFSESVKKVYFPINAEDNHWILVEFHIRSGVITFYDSLPPENLIVEDQKWWLYARQVYANKLPKLLIQSEVMEKKNIDPSNYSISYRLLNNLPLEVSNPTQAGLAYREHLTYFF